jgi:hypothetical protein
VTPPNASGVASPNASGVAPPNARGVAPPNASGVGPRQARRLADQVWEAIKRELQGTMTRGTFDAWLRRSRPALGGRRADGGGG